MRRSIHSRSATPGGRSRARACCTARSPPTLDRFASSLLRQVARKSKSAVRSCSSSLEKESVGSEPKKASRRSSFPEIRRSSWSSPTRTSPPMRFSTHSASGTLRGRKPLAAAATSGSFAASAACRGPWAKSPASAERSFSSSGANASVDSSPKNASAPLGSLEGGDAFGVGKATDAGFSGSATRARGRSITLPETSVPKFTSPGIRFSTHS
mmetsp:Transcript_76692/g.237506  ORF Transcript_76692/g.237506 Transcript_76692/m.237506 type:complete len:212 (-) Transcript_76692:115-750(-)